MYLRHRINTVVAPLKGARCTKLTGLMRAEGWNVELADGIEGLLKLAESGLYHMAILATTDGRDLPRLPVRSLMSLQTDMCVLFLVPEPGNVAGLPALVGATSDQVLDVHSSPKTLVGLLKDEINSVLAAQDEHVIIAVDDDEEFLSSLEAYLPPRVAQAFPRFEMNFEFFKTPREALTAAQEIGDDRLAVVISDQVMPEMDGIELLGRIKEACPSARRVLLTGHAGIDSAVAAINAQVLDRYFSKPIEAPGDFAASIQQLFREHCLRMKADAHRHRLMAQFEYIRAISSTQDIDAALAITAAFLQEQVHPRRVMVALSEEGRLVVRGGTSLPAEMGVGTPLPDEKSLCRWVLRQGRPVIAAREEDLPAGSESLLASLPLIAAPVVWGEHPLGVILAAGRWRDRPFSREDRMLVSFVADVASVSIGGLEDREALEQHYMGTMACLMETVEAKDDYTRGHTERVTELAVALAEAVGVGGSNLENIRRAAALHDIGKIAVPDSIILKPGRLDPEERAVMKEHSGRGDRILQHLGFLSSARMIIRGHHERYDGAGYPDGLQGEEIPLGARILAIADTYDAMTSVRPYRRAGAAEDALAETEVNAGKQFDPALVAAFLEMMKERLPRAGVPVGADARAGPLENE